MDLRPHLKNTSLNPLQKSKGANIPKKCKPRTANKKKSQAYLNSKKKMQIRQKEKKLKKLKEKINQLRKIRRPPHLKLPSLMTLITRKYKMEKDISIKTKLNPNSSAFLPDNKPTQNTPRIPKTNNPPVNCLDETSHPLYPSKRTTDVLVNAKDRKHTNTISQPKEHVENKILLWNCNKATWSLKKRAVL